MELDELRTLAKLLGQREAERLVSLHKLQAELMGIQQTQAQVHSEIFDQETDLHQEHVSFSAIDSFPCPHCSMICPSFKSVSAHSRQGHQDKRALVPDDFVLKSDGKHKIASMRFEKAETRVQ